MEPQPRPLPAPPAPAEASRRLLFPEIAVLPLGRYEAVLGTKRLQQTLARIDQFRAALAGRVVWNVSSSAVGGGVAEMVRSLLAYARGAGVDARWAVIQAPPEFFQLTKRLHNALHGSPGDGSALDAERARLYRRITAESAAQLAPMVRPRDVVIVHDPQPAGMIPELLARGAHVVWRCHIGHDQLNDEVERGWSFLVPFLRDAPAYVFSRAAYVPPQLDPARAVIITPSLDPFSAKNQPLDEAHTRAILTHVGILSGTREPELCTFAREDGTPARVDRYVDLLSLGPPPSPEVPLVVQVSRWDRLKDPLGVMQGFARLDATAARGAHLVLAGPNVRGVADDTEDGLVYDAVVEAWRSLPEEQRQRVHLAALPTADVDENGAIVNALQRHAAIIVQKSLHEGFGLTVTEGMWKNRPVVASAVGGIPDQITDGVHGLLVGDPTDLDAFAAALARLLGDPSLAKKLGDAARARVVESFLGIDSLLRFGALIERLDGRQRAASAS